tara:strand:- start:2108 stop:2971 length:864 start_codon:yes stop_codon:yes gene_type:complete
MSHKDIIWLASYPKSGNTWLRLFFEQYLMEKFDLNKLLMSVGDDVSTRYGVGDGSDPRELPIELQHLTRPMALLRLVKAFKGNKPVAGLPLFVKTHNANIVTNGVTLLPEQLTHATIHIVRDPRDIAVSFSKHLGVDIDKTIGYMEDKYRVLNAKQINALKMDDFISSWRLHTKSFIEGDLINTRTFRYEDMIDNPVDTFSSILTHAGIEPDRVRVIAALEAVALQKLRAREEKDGFIEASHKNKSSFFGSGGSTWRDVLTLPQSRRIVRMADDVMRKLNYIERKVA